MKEHIKTFLDNLEKQGVTVTLKGDALKCRAPRGALTEAFRKELADRKKDIVAFLQDVRESLAPSANDESPQGASQNAAVPLSFAQQRFWFLYRFEGKRHNYNVPVAMRIKGRIDLEIIEKVFKEIIGRHEILRTAFPEKDGGPIQRIVSDARFTMPVIDIDERDLTSALVEECCQKLDLEEEPPFKVKLFRIAEFDVCLLMVIHHIIIDEWSVDIFADEFEAIYTAFIAGEPSPLPELPCQYVDFCRYQRRMVESGTWKTQIEYWKQRLEGTPSFTGFPTDSPRPPLQTYEGSVCEFTVEPRIVKRLRQFADKAEVSIFMVMLAVMAVLLHRYTGRTDILIGSPISGRSDSRFEPLIGCFLNTLVFRNDLSGDPGFMELLERIKETALGAWQNQDIPFEKLVDEIKPERNLSHHPLFQTMLVVQHSSGKEKETSEFTVTPVNVEFKAARFDAIFTLLVDDDEIAGSLEYNVDLFERRTVERITGHFKAILKAVVENPKLEISLIPILAEEETRTVLFEWSGVKSWVDYNRADCAHWLFEDRAKLIPDAIALVGKNESLTYQELNVRANRLAHILQGKGVGPDSAVAVFAERSPDTLVGILAVMKARGAYLPVDPSHPRERILAMLADSGARFLLTGEACTAKFSFTELRNIRPESVKPFVTPPPAFHRKPGRIADS